SSAATGGGRKGEKGIGGGGYPGEQRRRRVHVAVPLALRGGNPRRNSRQSRRSNDPDTAAPTLDASAWPWAYREHFLIGGENEPRSAGSLRGHQSGARFVHLFFSRPPPARGRPCVPCGAGRRCDRDLLPAERNLRVRRPP